MATVWELDFYSRPIWDDNQKKIWEVLVCESPQNTCRSVDSLFRYSEYCPGTQVNSIWLRQALEKAIAQAPSAPVRIRFFRRQMNNMITRACRELGIPAQPSRRTVTLYQWLRERQAQIYPQQPGYHPSVNPSVQFSDSDPLPLPSALQPDQWSVVSLEARTFNEMPEWSIDFGDAFPLSILDLSPETRIPGIIFYSLRAVPLAAWMSGVELAFLKVNRDPSPCLLLATGASDCWIVARLTSPNLQAEVQGFETAKQAARGVHFLAVQTDPQSEVFAGFWLLQELDIG